MLLAFISFVFIFAVLQRSPWAQENVYERISTFRVGKDGLATIPGLNNDRLQEHLADEDAYDKFAEGLEDERASVRETKTITPAATAAGSKAKETKDGIPTTTTAEPTPTRAHAPWLTDPARMTPIPPPVSRPRDFRAYMEKMLDWPRPDWDGHWPPFEDYIDMAYDPNRWEEFD